MDRENSQVCRVLEEASFLVSREKEAARNAGSSEGRKRKQIEALKTFALQNDLLIDLSVLHLTFLSKGGENEVFTGDDDFVLKLNNFEYAGDDLTRFFFRINAHNQLFSNVSYEMIGFAYNAQHEFCAVLIQPYIPAKREATEDEIITYMEALGFEMDYIDEFHNAIYEVFDAVPNNVLYGLDDDLYFIDTQIRQLHEDGIHS